jgi:hypothetical protein
LAATVASLAEFATLMKIAATAYDQAVDPPDADYKTPPVPRLINVPELDALPDSPTKDASLISLQIESLTTAAATATNRAAGADLAGDAAWQARQLAAAAGFMGQASALEARLTVLEGQIAPGLTANVAAHAAEVAAYVSRNGLPASGEKILAEVGFTPAQVANITASVAGLPPEAFDDTTLTVDAMGLLSLTTNALGSERLAQAAQVRVDKLGQMARDLNVAERQGLDADWAKVQSFMGGRDASDAFLTAVSQYMTDIGRLAEATNNSAALQADSDQARSALAGYQRIGLAGAVLSTTLAPIADQKVVLGNRLTVAVAATGQNYGVTLTYTLDPGAPAGAKIDPKTGAFAWTPTAPGKYSLTVRVTDNSSPPISDTKTFTVTVEDVAPLSSGFGAGRDAFVTMLYTEDLGRQPEPSGLRFWSGLLFAGVKPKTVAFGIWNSPEHHALVNQHLITPITFERSYADALRAGQLAARFHSSPPAGPLAFSFTRRGFRAFVVSRWVIQAVPRR